MGPTFPFPNSFAIKTIYRANIIISTIFFNFPFNSNFPFYFNFHFYFTSRATHLTYPVDIKIENTKEKNICYFLR